MNTTGFCYGCMEKKNVQERYCSYCGFNHEEYMRQRVPQALKPGVVLQKRYVLGKVLGKGGFGITYIGFDTKLQIKVAVKEYFPSGLASRDNPGDTQESREVSVVKNPDRYRKELERFVQEARTLASFNQETGIVTVLDIFTENNTGYYVMDYLPGKTLKQIITERNRPMGTEEVLKLLTPVFNSLRVVHRSKIIHRDISPDNLVINKGGKLTLIDFGASQKLDKGQTEGLILKHGYSPIEQYDPNGEQGPWTDVYSLSATIYYMMTMRVPPRAVDRAKYDQIIPLSQFAVNVPEYFSAAIMTGLSVDPRKRFQSVSALLTALQKDTAPPPPPPEPDPLIKILVIVLATLIFVAIIGLAILLLRDASSGKRSGGGTTTQMAAGNKTSGGSSTATTATTTAATATTTVATTTASRTATTATTRKKEPKLVVDGVSKSNGKPDYHDYEDVSDFRTISINGGAESFGYPVGFFSKVEKNDDDFYTFSTSDGSATYKVGPVYGVSDPKGYLYDRYDHYKSILNTTSSSHNGVDINPRKKQSNFPHAIVSGEKRSDSSRGVYFIAAVKNGMVYTQEFEYKFQNDHKLSHQNYLIECLYQTCSFSGTSHSIRSFREYKDKKGEW